MALGTDYAQQDCSLARALEVVGERWSLLIVRDAFYGVRRFNDFLVHLDIPRAVLTARLRALVEAGVLRKEPYQDGPVRYEYLLTEAGLELWLPVHALARWGERHAAEHASHTVFTHDACGNRISPVGICVPCGVAVAPAHVVMRPAPGDRRSPRTDPVTLALARPRALLTPVLTEGQH
ncbi:helix-turn-helix domain-containing protein [Kitasatospora sp. GAS204B]|uniref:winged helix-turn-helix transcriptional regulator n=1 Tax=unclassified Kitasatospora TaxID=2633591 RepID=UPI0024770686|nr:helix-turn-helix domain-containing protein [Kitasatospora sp. GAS204B]MDH6118402.1 DNA-binding HxlR family transcriptional regulator [Kitasatospora sp. GAS204B]